MDEFKITETLYWQGKRLWLARMRFAKELEKTLAGRFCFWCVEKLKKL